MKTLFSILAFVALVALAVPSVHAQQDGKYYLYLNNVAINGGTNRVAVTATNTYSAFAVSEHDYVGLQISFKGTASGTSTVQIQGYQSIDSTTYETTPSLNRLVALNGTTLVCTNIDVFVPSAAVYKLVIGNTNETVAVTNLTAQWRVKSPMREVR